MLFLRRRNLLLGECPGHLRDRRLVGHPMRWIPLSLNLLIFVCWVLSQLQSHLVDVLLDLLDEGVSDLVAEPVFEAELSS